MPDFRVEEKESMGEMERKEKYPEIKMLSLHIVLQLHSDQGLSWYGEISVSLGQKVMNSSLPPLGGDVALPSMHSLAKNGLSWL